MSESEFTRGDFREYLNDLIQEQVSEFELFCKEVGASNAFLDYSAEDGAKLNVEYGHLSGTKGVLVRTDYRGWVPKHEGVRI